ncbi:hypothetical Protein YC6258_04605 [Gynuella sunshinyii YC6258]|uniref:Uncharacterized protein n=1 Tax=Gynuella sunshinyii YC6258 TaxID=1445510 RepID=A0A0C5VPT3_9GAMM|nr:hypothetical Protein YC6258_04605 [Gynuella sunshinyii YC6258]
MGYCYPAFYMSKTFVITSADWSVTIMNATIANLRSFQE